jgi:hypothetical protein
MRVLSIGNFGTGWDGSICDEEHIARALEGFGHEVVRHQREDQSYDLHGRRYDMVLIAQWDGYSVTLLTRLRALYNALTVYWAFDYQADGQRWHENLISTADLYLSKRVADSKYPNWQWLSQDFAPDFLIEEYHHKTIDNKDIDVLFTGSYLPWATERNDLLKAIDQEFNLVVHSVTPDAWRDEGLKQVYGPVMDHGLPELYSRAKVNISIDHTLEAGYWSDRNAQIMACGGFVLSRYVPLSEATFHDYVAYFYNIEDCLHKIRYYLADDFERERMASTARHYAEDNLMVTTRVRDLLTIVGARL